jgi:hypothetical protein
MIQYASNESGLNAQALKAHPKFYSRLYKGIPQICRASIWLSLALVRLPTQEQITLYKVNKRR